MAHPNRNLVFIVFCCLNAACLAHGRAQDPPRRVQFTVYSAARLGGLAYVVTQSPVRQTRPIAFFMTSRSPTYEIKGAGPVEFIDVHTGATVAQVDIPAEVAAPMLIFFPIATPPGAGRGFRVFIYDDAWSKLSVGGLVVLNFTGTELTGMIDRAKLELVEGYCGPYAVGQSAQVQLRTKGGDRRYFAYSEAITLGKSGRALLMLLPPRYRGSRELQSRILLDEVPVPDKQGGAAKP